MVKRGINQGIRKKGKPIVKCDKCRKIVNVKPKRKKVGDIEYIYMVCRHCSALYVISATDEALRRDIKRFEEMTDTEEILSEEKQRAAQALLNANVARSRELKKLYPLE